MAIKTLLKKLYQTSLLSIVFLSFFLLFAYPNFAWCVNQFGQDTGTVNSLCVNQHANSIGNCEDYPTWHAVSGQCAQDLGGPGSLQYECCEPNNTGTTSCGSVGGTCQVTCSSNQIIDFNGTSSCTGLAGECCRPKYCEDYGGTCISPNIYSRSGCNAAGNNYTDVNPYACSDGASACCTQEPACTGAPYANCGTCNYSYPTNTCGTTSAPNYTCQYNGPQPCYANGSPSFSCSNISYNTCSAGYSCPNGAGFHQACVTTITVHVYKDYNHDGTVDGNDEGMQTTVSDGGAYQSTDGSGNYTFNGLTTGNYTITMTVPAGYQAVGASTQQVTLTNNVGNQTVNFYLTPLYTISGTVFTDLDQSQCYNSSGQSCVGKNGLTYAAGTDTAFTNGSHITIAGPVNTSVNASSGGYNSTQILTSGTYTVTYDTGTTPLPSGYRFTTSQSYSVTVGDSAGTPTCSIGAAPDTLNTKCQSPNNGSIVQLNFGVINETQWQQSICNDVRVDSGYSQQIPSTANCSNTSSTYAIMGNNICPLDNTNTASNQGVLFSGNTNPNTGQGSVSSGGQQVGNSTYGEIFIPHSLSTIESKYALVMESLNNLSTPATKLSTVCPVLTNCDLKTLPGGGVYTTTAADGPVTLFASGDNTLASQNYTFVIGGDLTITSNILTPVGYSAAFISGGDIHVTGTGNTNAGEVGETDWTSTSPDLEGFFSADGSLYVDRINTADFTCNTDGSPIDKKLNIAGTVVTNASGNGGSIVNNREGCSEDLQCPTILFPPNVQQILHPPTPLRIPLTFWSELNP